MRGGWGVWGGPGGSRRGQGGSRGFGKTARGGEVQVSSTPPRLGGLEYNHKEPIKMIFFRGPRRLQSKGA